MTPKLPIQATDGTITTDVNLINVSEGSIGANGEITIEAGSVAIGGAITDATQGSVLFAGAAGVLAQNNTAFKWTDASNQLGLTSGAVGNTPLLLKGFAAQTANIIEWRNSANAIVFGGVTNGTHGAELRLGDTSTTDYGRIYSPGVGGVALSNRAAGANAEIMYLGITSTLAARMASGAQLTWSSSTPDAAAGDVGIVRIEAGILKVTDASTGAGSLEFLEQTAPSAATANSVRIYAQDNGAGKTQLMARFASGAAQQIAIEP